MDTYIHGVPIINCTYLPGHKDVESKPKGDYYDREHDHNAHNCLQNLVEHHHINPNRISPEKKRKKNTFLKIFVLGVFFMVRRLAF